MATAGSAELTITLAEERSINRLRIVTAEEYLQSFDLEVSTDGQNYEIVGSYTTTANDSAFIEFDPVNALYVRLGQITAEPDDFNREFGGIVDLAIYESQ